MIDNYGIQMLEFNENPVCIKCGFSAVDMKYKKGDVFMLADRPPIVLADYFRVKCMRCSYEWTMICKDYKNE
jgi:hypothetical protein